MNFINFVSSSRHEEKKTIIDLTLRVQVSHLFLTPVRAYTERIPYKNSQRICGTSNIAGGLGRW